MSRVNRYVGEVCGGLALFFNCTVEVEDGWWWGSDEAPWQWGPFASCEEALANARRGAERFKLVRWDAAELRRPDRPLPPRGHLIIVDTGGKVWRTPAE